MVRDSQGGKGNLLWSGEKCHFHQMYMCLQWREGVRILPFWCVPTYLLTEYDGMAQTA